MRAFYPTSVVFTPGATGVGTIVLSSVPNFDIRNLGIINNLTQRKQIYAAGIEGQGYTALGGVNNSTITLQFDTTSHSTSDQIQLLYDADNFVKLKDANGVPVALGRTRSLSSLSVTLAPDVSSVPVSNGDVIISESFASVDSNTWTIVLTSNDIITVDGNAVGNDYLVVSLDPLGSGTSCSIETKGRFPYPMRFMMGASRNIACIGKEVSFEIVTDEILDTIPPIQIAQAWQNAAVSIMLSTVQPHNLKVGQSILLENLLSASICFTSLVVAATPSTTLLSCIGGPNGGSLQTSLTYSNLSTGGYIYRRSRMGGATNGVAMIWENSTNTNASFYNRSGAGDSGDTLPGCSNANFVSNHSTTIGSYAPVAPFTLPNVYCFLPTTQFELITQSDYIEWFDRAIDSSTAIPSLRLKRDQMVPDPNKLYKFRIRAVNNKSVTKPDFQILSANRIASNTWILSTNGVHGYIPLQDTVLVYGMSDQINFPNVTTAVAVCAVPTPTSLTIVTGTVGTFQAVGGYVARQKSANPMSLYGAVTQQISAVQRTSNVLTLSSGNGTWTSTSIGEYVNIVGCISAGVTTGESLNIDGPYRVQNLVANLLYLEPITAYNAAGNVYTASPTGTDFGLTSGGGAIVRRVNTNINYIRAYKYNRNIVETHGGFMRNDVAASFPTYIVGSALSNQTFNLNQIASQGVQIAGLNGTLAVGGNVLLGVAVNKNTLNPLVVGVEDLGGLTKRASADMSGGITGPGEFNYQYVLNAGNFTATEGTNAKSFFIPPKDSQLFFGVKEIGTGITTQIEGSYDNRIFNCIPLTRIDNVASSNTYTCVSAFTPVINAQYKGNTYGYPIIRIHNTSLTTAILSGVLRIIPNYEIPGQTILPFTLSGGGFAEAQGNVNGNVMYGGVRTMPILNQGSTKCQLVLDHAVGVFNLVLEGSSDNETTYNTVSCISLSGGGKFIPFITINSVLATPSMGLYEANVSNMTHVRLRQTSWTSGSANGAMKLTSIPSMAGIGNSDKASYTASVYNQAYTTASGLISAIAIESGATKNTRVKRVMVQPGFATATTTATLCVFRYTTAAVTGTTLNAASMQKEVNDPAFTGLAKTNVTNVNTSINTLTQFVFQIPVPASTLSAPAPLIFDFTNGGTEKGISIPVGATNGLLFGYSGSGAGGTGFGMSVDFTEE